eukprot:CAMPEP_0197286242 /NCGR_PEP_ID=MMETSP0890-20130614/1706_1 /TAXON_ID=44058 ORGANISM="Aureoumbra lagunensis, Strain CCMP1510" /NCGR_SAMPLE_ID=MMETSP0890 /ASSEMBLY_ACC=CAM_ASM_000533 /LENGTH=388 /DNA_ID=CAMNT_0042754461 /DNA_START=26 /DNA_END=1192 /DNA_ORIENTATION=+
MAGEEGPLPEPPPPTKKEEDEATTIVPPVNPTFSFGTNTKEESQPTTSGGFTFNLAPQNTEEVDDDSSDDDEKDGEPLSREVLQRVLGLKRLHEQYEDVLKQYAAERCELEKRYREKTGPILEARSKVVKGELEPEITEEDKKTIAQAKVADPVTETEEKNIIRGVPDFWLGALGRNEACEALLEEDDIDALKYLVDVRCIDFDDMKGFTLEFEFVQNPYFTNSILTKTYHVPNLIDANGQPELEKISGCKIDWKNPNDCLVAKQVHKKQKARRGKNAGMTRIVTKLEPRPSFFRFFDSIKLPTSSSKEDDDDDDDDDDEEAIRDRIDTDVELAFALRNHVIPDAVLWFTGEAVDDDDDDEDDDEELLRSINHGIMEDDDDDDDDDDN